MMQPPRQLVRPIGAAALHAGQPAFGYPGYASAAGAFHVGR